MASTANIIYGCGDITLGVFGSLANYNGSARLEITTPKSMPRQSGLNAPARIFHKNCSAKLTLDLEERSPELVALLTGYTQFGQTVPIGGIPGTEVTNGQAVRIHPQTEGSSTAHDWYFYKMVATNNLSTEFAEDKDHGFQIVLETQDPERDDKAIGVYGDSGETTALAVSAVTATASLIVITFNKQPYSGHLTKGNFILQTKGTAAHRLTGTPVQGSTAEKVNVVPTTTLLAGTYTISVTTDVMTLNGKPLAAVSSTTFTIT